MPGTTGTVPSFVLDHCPAVPQAGREQGADRPTYDVYYEKTSRDKARPMAGTSLRRWTLLPVVLMTLLAMIGDELPEVTYQSGVSLGLPWKCPRCGHEERTRLPKPLCRGEPRKRHKATDAKRVSEQNFRPSGGPPVFE